MIQDIKHLARRYRKQYLSGKPTPKEVCAALKDQGYQVISYRPEGNDEATETLLQALSLEDFARSTRGFTYADSEVRLVFVHADLSEEEKLLILLHEQGHILCGHLKAAAILGQDILQEFEANEFVHHLLTPSPARRFCRWAKRRKKPLLIGTGLVVAACAAIAAWFIFTGSKTYYITSTGFKYHEKDCHFLKNKENVQEITWDDLKDSDYAPCEFCITE